MPGPLADSLNSLVPVFQELADALHQEKKGREQDRQERQRDRRRYLTAIGILIIAVAAVISLQISYHSTTSAVGKNTRVIEACVFPPKHASPVGTPFPKLTCYERSQAESAAFITIILQYERQLDQFVLNIFHSNVQLPQPSFVLPGGKPING